MEDKAMKEKAVSAEKTEWKFSKSAEYWDDVDNYAIPHELTVTITLSEYKKLLTQEAEAKASKYNSDWCAEYDKNQKLQKEVNALKKRIAELEGGENNG